VRVATEVKQIQMLGINSSEHSLQFKALNDNSSSMGLLVVKLKLEIAFPSSLATQNDTDNS